MTSAIFSIWSRNHSRAAMLALPAVVVARVRGDDRGQSEPPRPMSTWQQICAAAFSVGMAVAMAALTRAARRPPVLNGDRLLLRYPVAARWLFWCGALLMVVCLAGEVRPFIAGTAGPFQARTLALAATMTVVFLVAAWREGGLWLEVDGVGIGGRTAFRGQRRVAWRDLVEVRWHRRFQHFVLIDRSGQRLRVPRLLQGHAVVPMMLREHVPEPQWRDAVARWRRDIDREPDAWSLPLAFRSDQNLPDSCTTTALPPRSSERTTSKP